MERSSECESKHWSDWHQAHRVAQLSLAQDLHSEWDSVVSFCPYDGESFTRGRLNIILKLKDTGSNLISYVAGQVISVLASLSLSVRVSPHPTIPALCSVLCVCVCAGHWPRILQLLLLFKLLCQHRQCSGSVGCRRNENSLMTCSGSSYVCSVVFFRLSRTLNHNQSNKQTHFLKKIYLLIFFKH